MAGNLMIQGTMSGVGKSLLTAGILRVLRQDGWRAAPFKSQNMALNSYVTADGLEMGRAQVMQAEAAGIEPEVCMNPILLKPTTDVGSQLIVHGRVRGNYTAQEYFRMKRGLVPDIMSAYERLREQTDIIVIEGAGSPAEINLKADDIVNMGMAKLADAPVLLVGDIDRGGVFAQFLGTVELLEAEERKRIKGFVINKFRGDEKLLAPGPEMLRDRCAIPTLGVLPYLRLVLDDEDSLAESLSVRRPLCERGRNYSSDRQEEGEAGAEQADSGAHIGIAVIRLPHISNFTDVNPLAGYPFVSLSYVENTAQLERFGMPDLILLPGTKNTIGDMAWLRETGLERAILAQAARGCRIMGICGGYQMLGDTIADEAGSEGGGAIRGMGLLPVDTIFAAEKRRSRITGTVGELPKEWRTLSGLAVGGYEIHMGGTYHRAAGERRADGRPNRIAEAGNAAISPHALRTDADGCAAAFCTLEDGRPDGCVCGRVIGTYLHGILETDEFTRCLLMLLGKEKGIDGAYLEQAIAAAASYRAFKESQYDLLADAVRQHLDMERICEIIHAGSGV